MKPNHLRQLRLQYRKANEIVRYYRVGPLGDVAAINGKIVEESMRIKLQESGLGKVGTYGVVDLGVSPWNAGFQVKTFRKKANHIIFTRITGGSKRGRIESVKRRIVESLKRNHVQELYLLDIDMMTGEFSVYRLASLSNNGILRTYGTFLKSDHVRLTMPQSHFHISKVGLLKIA